MPDHSQLRPCANFRLSTANSFALLGLLALAAGCCGPSRPTTYPVYGTVTFNGGPPPAEGAI
ncbi:MAG: hypothetical protein KDA41_10285, partial [Planctomycetales bacterium]|nr:hypothetical protein [Planctomycetales bacterium]